MDVYAAYNQGGVGVLTTPAVQQWVDKDDKYATPNTVGRVYADANVATRMGRGEDFKQREELYSRTLELGKQLNDTNFLLQLIYCKMIHLH